VRAWHAIQVDGWPLKLIVRRPLNMRRRTIRYVIVLLASLLQSCATSSVSTPSQENVALLTALNKCLKDMPTVSPAGFVSPCAKMTVAGLSGISIQYLENQLGHPDVSSGDYVFAPNDKSAPPPPFECRWGFYRLPPNIVNGGGPELQCVSEDRRTCNPVRWVRTE
jgi:hypothetical protein